MAHPENYRVYGVLLRDGRVLTAAEYVADTFAWKYPGGGVEPDESAEQALVREFREEAGMDVRVVAELHDPGTKISPWTRRPYTPVYFLVESDDHPAVPEHEEIAMSFRQPAELLSSELVAEPERAALRAALALGGDRCGTG